MKGGYRQGAGRKPGSKTKKTVDEAIKAAQEGLTPLQHMLKVLRDENQPPERRDWAAEKAAPFIHPRLQTTTVKGEGEGGSIPMSVKVTFVNAS